MAPIDKRRTPPRLPALAGQPFRAAPFLNGDVPVYWADNNASYLHAGYTPPAQWPKVGHPVRLPMRVNVITVGPGRSISEGGGSAGDAYGALNAAIGTALAAHPDAYASENLFIAAEHFIRISIPREEHLGGGFVGTDVLNLIFYQSSFPSIEVYDPAARPRLVKDTSNNGYISVSAWNEFLINSDDDWATATDGGHAARFAADKALLASAYPHFARFVTWVFHDIGPGEPMGFFDEILTEPPPDEDGFFKIYTYDPRPAVVPEDRWINPRSLGLAAVAAQLPALCSQLSDLGYEFRGDVDWTALDSAALIAAVKAHFGITT